MRRSSRSALSASAWRRGLRVLGLVGLLVGASVSSAEEPDVPVVDPVPSVIERWRSASPAERRERRAALRERWEEASPRDRRRLGRSMRALERRLPDFSTIERLVLLRAAAALPEDERASLRRRIAGIDDLEPAARASLIAELKAMIGSYSAEIDRLERNTDRWREMSAAEREEVREQMRRLREMSVEERRALLEELEKSRRGARGPGDD